VILNTERYRYSVRRKRRRGWLLLLILLLAAGTAVLTWRLRIVQRLGTLLRPPEQSQSMAELWRDRRYDELIARCDAVLAEEPLDTRSLVYRGFACFYKAVSEVTLEERIPYLDQAILSLRRAALDSRNPWAVETEYVLGKSYYHKGKYYWDLTLRYLGRALAAGYRSADIYDYLGLTATQLDRVEEGLGYFHQALEINPTDLLLLMIGQSYLQLGRVQEAEEYLIRAINKTEDTAVEQRSRFLLGQLYFDRGDYLKAEDEYKRILSLDPNSADAHFYLGEIYSKMNDPVRARAEWRRTLVIDPQHYGARTRYYR
jgi:tetratricopeptide (TPR) repeat protein